MIRRLHGLKRDVDSSVGSHGLIPVIGSVRGRPEVGSRPSERRECGLERFQKMIPVIGSVLGRPEAGSRPSERRECGLETPENESSYWIGA